MSSARSSSKFSRGTELLQAALVDRGWSQRRLHREIGGNANPSFWLNGLRRPSLEVALRLRDLLEIPVDAWVQEPSRSQSEAA